MAQALTALPSDIPPSGTTQAGRLYLPCHHEDHPEQWGVAKPPGRSLKQPGLIHLLHQHFLVVRHCSQPQGCSCEQNRPEAQMWKCQ